MNRSRFPIVFPLVLFVLLFSVLPCCAFSLYKPKKVQEAPPRTFPANLETIHHASGLSPSEVGSIFRGVEALETYGAKNLDCFQRASRFVKGRCGQELEMNEDERVTVAISMTLCELATAKHYSPPMECSPFSPTAFESAPVMDPNSQHLRAVCVEALSRSAQFWSSYSGYLRDAPQLCFAFRRWHDIDMAKAIYHNATLEKLSLLSLLKGRENSLILQGQQIDASWHILERTIDILRETVDAVPSKFSEMMREEVNSQMAHLGVLQQQLYSVAIAREEDLTLQTREAMQDSIRRHGDALFQVVSTVHLRLDESLQMLDTRSAAMVESYRALDVKWQVLGEGMTVLYEALTSLKGQTTEASAALASSVKTAAEQQTLLQESFRALSEEAIDAMREMNRTAWDARQGWLRDDLNMFSTWRIDFNGFEKMVQLVYYALPVIIGLAKIGSRVWPVARMLYKVTRAVWRWGWLRPVSRIFGRPERELVVERAANSSGFPLRRFVKPSSASRKNYDRARPLRPTGSDAVHVHWQDRIPVFGPLRVYAATNRRTPSGRLCMDRSQSLPPSFGC